MTALTLTLKHAPSHRVDLSALTSGGLELKAPKEIAAIELTSARGKVRVGEIFRVTGNDPGNIVIKGSCDRLDRIGQGMDAGSIAVHGDAGAYVGFGMSGGQLTVDGSVGAFAASGMKGGDLQIRGSAGDFLAAAVAGEHRGMRGGTVHVTGDAGDRVGDHMRRGSVLIEGNVGAYCASRMTAGTIAVLGTAGTLPGFAMHRGTLLLFGSPPPRLPATFNDCGEHELGFLTLLIRSWQRLRGPFAGLATERLRTQRFMGDLACGGKGEILVFR